ncbi:hypothetical protein FRC07_007747 [Ceratobasidium sp. 392]|nr:hypothetical protein FRC07_007747 [Ceratobasidium sp. 392]
MAPVTHAIAQAGESRYPQNPVGPQPPALEHAGATEAEPAPVGDTHEQGGDPEPMMGN